jgi:hypothetical protein
MIEPKNRELQAARIEIAIQICLSFPQLYPKCMGMKKGYMSDKEYVAACVLGELMKLEPSIKHILDFHYKRMVR